jgi:hypothetical protein
MTNAHPVGILLFLLRSGIVALLLTCSATLALAQTEIANLVDAPTAAQRLSTHFPAIEAAFAAMNVNDPGYALEAARVEFTMHVYEDVQQNIAPQTTIRTRFDEGMGAPYANGRPTVDEASANGALSPAIEYDPIVAELVNLLQQ